MCIRDRCSTGPSPRYWGRASTVTEAVTRTQSRSLRSVSYTHLYLTEDQMPKQWYNLRADMKEQPDPLLHPGTHQPLPEEALYPIFCEKLAHQELDGKTRYIDIPEPILDMYKPVSYTHLDVYKRQAITSAWATPHSIRSP